MKDKGIGQKRVRIIATIYRMSDNDILATEKFYLCYERKSLPNHIVTSAPCYLYTAANSNSSNILYPTILPVDINVYRRGVKNTIQINNTRETILYSPKVEVSNTVMIKACYECGTTFIWNEERSSRGMTGNARKSISYQITAATHFRPFSAIFCHFRPLSTCSPRCP